MHVLLNMMKRLNSWFEIDEHEYLMYLLQGYKIAVEEYRVRWTFDDKLHRTDGPAVIYQDGYRAWLINGKFHRTDGPAIITPSKAKCWFLYDIRYDIEDEFNEAIKQLISVDNH